MSMSDAVASRGDSETPSSPEGAVQNHIDLVIDHLIGGRTTAEQRRGLKSATERADRVTSGSDAAVGRALR